ncbi:MAG: hypothetical protein AAF090_16190 [Bacteroidota bacterium]
MKYAKIYILFLGLMVMSCGGDSSDGPPPAPGTVTLVFPDQNSECTTGTVISDSQSEVTFEWQSASNAEGYILIVTNLNTNTRQTLPTQATSGTLAIDRGTPFSWIVTATNSQSSDVSTSESWLFYNEGSQTTYAPFPAQLVEPVSGSTVIRTDTGQVRLIWQGADVENDIASYDIQLSTTNPPTDNVGTQSNLISDLFVEVNADTVYYWRVITTDAEGNSSTSSVFEFKAL